MANDELLTILRKGTAAWNAWLENFKPDLSRLDIGLDLSGADLVGMDLSEGVHCRATIWMGSQRQSG